MKLLRWTLVCLGLFFLRSPALAQNDAKTRPNVLFIAIDDLNDWVGCLGGHPQAKTPNLDRLAGKGVLFTKAYCSAPCCNPSRASLLSGIRPHTSGVYSNNQPWRPVMPEAVTLMRHFLNSGYLVWGSGKITHGSFPDPDGWHEYFKGASKVKEKSKAEKGTGGNMAWGPLDCADTDLPDGQITDWAIAKLKQKHDRPFFMAVGYVKPHLSWHAPRSYFDMHPLAKVQLPKVLATDLDDVPPAGVKMAKPEGDHRAITKAGLWKDAVQAYLAAGTYMDAQLGRLLDAIEASPYANNTIIVLWSDHGWSLGEKEHWRKFALWENTSRVVFAMSVPGTTKPGQRCPRPVNLMDIYPTLIQLCKLPERKGLEGNDITPLLRDPQQSWPHPSLTTWLRGNHAVRNDRWRYIRYADGSEELYDHDADPLEWKNLAKEAQYADLMKDLACYLPKKDAPDAPSQKGEAKKNKKKKQAGFEDSVNALPYFLERQVDRSTDLQVRESRSSEPDLEVRATQDGLLRRD